MTPDEKRRQKRDLIAQWAFDTRPILGRLHLWLEDVEITWLRGGAPEVEFTQKISFLPGQMERLIAMTVAVTALGTKLFGRFGEGRGMNRADLNQVKKDADAISAYAMSESLWYATRQLPENHAIMVCLGEGLMPKGGETLEMGSNPRLGFGRIYARPQVAQWIDERVARMINDVTYSFEEFYAETKAAGITIWGAAIDTLENTSRFARGEDTGPMTVLHLFDQPLRIRRPYEGYVGNLFLPRQVAEQAAKSSVLLNFRTPRAKVVEAIEATYPGIRREHVHVWTLRGGTRPQRIGTLWAEWEAQGVHLVEQGWELPSGIVAFTDSGTYAPTYLIGTWQDAEDQTHLFLCDGYAASAEAMQAASLVPVLGLDGSLSVLTSRFELSWEKERDIMGLDPEAADFAERVRAVADAPLEDAKVEDYRRMIREARDAGMPMHAPVVYADDFFPEKKWSVLAASGYMCPDPYTGARGVEQVSDRVYRTTARLATRGGEKEITFTFRIMEPAPEDRLIFNPLLNRFFYGEDFRNRPVRISDSGRIRNELQTLCFEALEHAGKKIRVHFDRIPPEVISPENRAKLVEVLHWYKEHHPYWFSWLEMVGPG